jgi:ABC-2 type transport system permease protein
LTLPNSPTTASSATGSIYDLGYRRYDGPRLGRPHAVRALLDQSLRSAFGIGRGGRAKIAPLTLGVLIVAPSVVVLALLIVAGQIGLSEEAGVQLGYAQYNRGIMFAVILFCAAQAPELFGRDQRYGTLSLYFARALRRTDYVLARAGGFVGALLILFLLPMAILLLGKVLSARDVVAGLSGEADQLVPIVLRAVLSAALLGSLAMAVAAFTPRRAYATAGIVALFTIPTIVVDVASDLGAGGGSDSIVNWLALLSAPKVLDGVTMVLFDTDTDVTSLGLPDAAWIGTAVVATLVAVAITVRRYLRLVA